MAVLFYLPSFHSPRPDDPRLAFVQTRLRAGFQELAPKNAALAANLVAIDRS
jgi:hypothetical protein